jgi:hypothetical protein
MPHNTFIDYFWSVSFLEISAMTTTIISSSIATRKAILIGTKEVTFTPYVIRKVGEVRSVNIDGVAQDVIYNERRNLTYLVLDIDGTPTTGRIADELKAGQGYDSFKKGTKAAPKAAPVAKAAPAPLVDPAAKAVAAAAKIRRAPKVAPAQAVAA